MSLPAIEGRLGRVELGGFRLQRVLGEGAFGTAYLAEQLGTDRLAVVKIAHAHLMAGPVRNQIQARYEAEVRAASRVHHPCLLTLYTAGTTSDGLPALATEFVPGETLGDFLARTPPRSVIQEIFEQLAEGIAAMHQHGIIHRDLSPDNVMVDTLKSGLRVKIIDFGIAKLTTQSSSGAHPIGTPRYIAPEQLRGAAEPASDIYGLGALLFLALAGREHLHDVSSVAELLVRATSSRPVEGPRSVRSNVTPAEDRLVCDLLAAEASTRPTAAEFLRRWRAIGVGNPEAVALFVDEVGELTRTVVEHLTERGFRVVTTSDPRLASRAQPKEYALIVVSAHLSTVDPVRLVGHLEEFLPEQDLWVVAREFSLAWQTVGRARCVRVPHDLPVLARSSRALPTEATPSSLPPVSSRSRGPVSVSPRIEDFIGGGAELLESMLEASRKHDGSSLLGASEQFARLASAAGAGKVVSLTRTLMALVSANELEDPEMFVDELGAAYRGAVRDFLNAAHS